MSDHPPPTWVPEQLIDHLEHGTWRVTLVFERTPDPVPVPVIHQSQIRTKRPGDHLKDDTAPLLEMARLIECDGLTRWNAACKVAGSMSDAKRLDLKFKKNGRSFRAHCLAIIASLGGWPDSLQMSAQAGRRWMLYDRYTSDSSLERLRAAAARGLLLGLLDGLRFHLNTHNEPN
jgi:hypothetical protein